MKRFDINNYLLAQVKKIAERNKWDESDVIEEALIYYLNAENFMGKSLRKLLAEEYTKDMKTKPQGKGIVKALGQKSATGNFKKIAKAKGKAAAIGALQNKLAARKGMSAPFGGKKK